MSFQSVAKSSNSAHLVIGEITAAEAEIASQDFPEADGKGVYLISVDSKNSSATGQVLAKFSSEDAAYELAKFFRLSGRMETA